MRFLSWLLLTCFLVACKSRQELPKGILKPEKMQDVFWDFIRADVYTTNFMTVSPTTRPVVENIRMQNKIFATHHVSKDEFYKSYAYYSNHKELMTVMIDSMVAKQQRQDSVKQTNKSGSPKMKQLYE